MRFILATVPDLPFPLYAASLVLSWWRKEDICKNISTLKSCISVLESRYMKVLCLESLTWSLDCFQQQETIWKSLQQTLKKLLANSKVNLRILIWRNSLQTGREAIKWESNQKTWIFQEEHLRFQLVSSLTKTL